MSTLKKLDSGDLAQGVAVLGPDGLIVGDTPPAEKLVQVIGRCGDVDNALRDLWDGPTALYVFPAAPIRMQVVSSSANDAAAGSGVRSVEIHYLDTDYVARKETLVLNGLTPVLTTALNILRVNQFHALSVGGVNAVAAGNISLQAVGGAVTYGFLAAGRNLARQAIYTVPDGLSLEIDHWQNSSGSTGSHFCQITLAATSNDGVLLPGVFLPKDEQGSQNTGTAVTFGRPIEKFPPRTDLRISAISDNAAANVIALGSFFGKLRPV